MIVFRQGHHNQVISDIGNLVFLNILLLENKGPYSERKFFYISQKKV